MVGYPLELWTGKAGERCGEVFRFMEQVYRHTLAEEEEVRQRRRRKMMMDVDEWGIWD